MTYKQKKAEEQKRDDIQKELPTFINRILLMLNSGMVLQEALIRIAEGYGSLGKERRNYFTVTVYDLYEQSLHSGENFLMNLHSFSKEARVKEFSRVMGILIDSRDKGVDVWERLAHEGEEMWAGRKQRALEKIKLTESKMSFPLGLLLIALIIITAAPAMLQMYID